jgi:uncharacterized protein (DUF1499 family)
MSFNLGLEALADHSEFDTTGDVLSYEFLDTVMQFNDEAAEAVVIADGITSLCGAYENLTAICDVLREHGNTPALEALVGGNFREGFSLEAAEAAKEGLWSRFVKWLKTLWAKIKAFFAKFFVSAKKMRTALLQRAKDLRNGTMEEVSIALPGNAVIKALGDYLKLEFKQQAEDNKKAIEDLQKNLKKEKSEVAKIDIKSQIEERETAAKWFADPTKLQIGKAAAIEALEAIAGGITACEVVEGIVNATAALVEHLSFTRDDRTAAQAYEAGKNAYGTVEKGQGHGKNGNLNKEDKAHNERAEAFGNLAKETDKYLGSDEFRKAVMEANAAISSFLKKATSVLVSWGSRALSTFKVAKVAKD